MVPTSDELFAQLQVLRAGEFVHLNGSLVDHLRGTERLLRQWGGDETLCIAGLYHAVYGTDGYNSALASVAMRHQIAALIGEKAEELAYLYGACQRQIFYPRIGTPAQLVVPDRFSMTEYSIRPEQLRQLCELILANELEIASGSPAFRAQYGDPLSKLFARMGGLVSEAGLRAAHSILSQAKPKP